MSEREHEEDRDACPHPEHGEPAVPDTKGALIVGHYAEGYLRAYFIHSLN